MDNTFNALMQIRGMALRLTDSLDEATLDRIPQGFNNNIIWNIGHMVAAMQGVCYKRSGLPICTTELFFEKYKPDTKPEGPATAEEIAEIKDMLLSSVEQLRADYQAGMFKTYTAFTTRYGVPINNIDEAISFLQFHEGMHVGYSMALKRAIDQERAQLPE